MMAKEVVKRLMSCHQTINLESKVVNVCHQDPHIICSRSGPKERL